MTQRSRGDRAPGGGELWADAVMTWHCGTETHKSRPWGLRARLASRLVVPFRAMRCVLGSLARPLAPSPMPASRPRCSAPRPRRRVCAAAGWGGGGGSLSSARLRERLARVLRAPANNSHPQPQPARDAAWEAWERVFAEVEDSERVDAALEDQLNEAVEREDYSAASALLAARRAISASDGVATLLSSLHSSLREERYEDAAAARDAGAGLLGWWAGVDEATSAQQRPDPRGCLLRITASHGRLEGRVHPASDLADIQHNVPVGDRAAAIDMMSALQRPVLEVFVRTSPPSGADAQAPGDDAGATAPQFCVRPVALCPLTGGPADFTTPASSEFDEEFSSDGDSTSVRLRGGASGEMSVHIVVEGGTTRPVTPQDDVMATLASQLAEHAAAQAGSGVGDSEKADEEAPGDVTFVMGQDPQNELGAVVWSDEFEGEEPLQRAPANLTAVGRSQFTFEYTPPPPVAQPPPGAASPDGDDGKARKSGGGGGGATSVSPDSLSGIVAEKWAAVAAEVARMDARGAGGRAALVAAVKAASEQTLAAQGLSASSEGGGKTRVTVTLGRGADAPGAPSTSGGWLNRGKGESPAGRASPQRLRFTRLDPAVVSCARADPLSALYLGSFGSHGPEVLQLVRGRWGDGPAEGPDASDFVTAVKLTGDHNVPAGRASFRARVGLADRLEHQGIYPGELGVVARYKGQGRAAKPGYREAQWVDGELLVLDGSLGGLNNGAELAFVWEVPEERRFLILLSKLKLPLGDTLL